MSWFDPFEPKNCRNASLANVYAFTDLYHSFNSAHANELFARDEEIFCERNQIYDYSIIYQRGTFDFYLRHTGNQSF